MCPVGAPGTRFEGSSLEHAQSRRNRVWRPFGACRIKCDNPGLKPWAKCLFPLRGGKPLRRAWNSWPPMTRDSTHDEAWMRLALLEARKGLGRTSPNPAVGAVITKHDRLLARAYHRRAGRPHAEIEAMRRLPATHHAQGSTLYVTLEPCSTSGRTPPCTEAIIRSGIRRVVVGAIDPNPSHQGRGLQRLREAGISVTAGVMERACTALNVGFNRWILTKRPW